MIRVATLRDLNSILTIVEEAKAVMQQDNNNQWDEHYPVESHFEEDINKETLYVLEENDEIYAFIVVDQSQSEWYDNLKWPVNREGAYVIHRLAASAEYKGAATKLFDFAVNLALDHDIHVMITDTLHLINVHKDYSKSSVSIKLVKQKLITIRITKANHFMHIIKI